MCHATDPMSQPSNLVKQLRQNKSLSQRDLAKLCDISQQHLQRIEARISPIQLNLAVRISDALGAPVNKVFPAFSPILKKFANKKSTSEPSREQLEQAGIEPEGVVWTAEFGLRAGIAKQFTLSSLEKRRLEAILRNWAYDTRSENLSERRFFWFDSEVYSVCVNLTQVTYARIMFDAPRIASDEDSTFEEMEQHAPSVLVWMVGRQTPLAFESEPDDASEQDDEEEPVSGQLEELLIDLDGGLLEDGFVSFVDSDGEDVFLSITDIAMIAIPHWLLKPDMFDEVDDSEDEDEATEEQDSQGSSTVQ